jgi:hypothetical protein
MKPGKIYPTGAVTILQHDGKDYIHTMTGPADSESAKWLKGENEVADSEIAEHAITLPVTAEKTVDYDDELSCNDGRNFYALIAE